MDHNNPDILFFLGNVYYELNDLNKSLFFFKKSHKNYPTSEMIIYNYAIALQSLGEINEAKLLFNKLIKINLYNIKAYYRLFRINENKFDNKHLEKLRNFENEDNFTLEDKSLINYMLAKHEQKNKNIDKEIKFLNKAHELNFRCRQKYNLKSSNYYLNFLSKNFDKIEFLNEIELTSNENKKSPIFIIGLPRSGSTLIESLLSQNKEKVYSYGECGVFHNSISNQVIDKPINTNRKFEIDIKKIDNLVKKIYEYSKEKNFIDKSLENFFYIDIILKIFPHAKFIHTYRNRFDAAIAIYQSMLMYLPWAHSLNNILIYILNYERIIEYFKEKYPEKILNINLEELTSSPEHVTKKIFNFCSMDWDNNVFEFYKSKNVSSKSSSFLQIRSKIQKYEKNKYKPYYNLILNNKEIKF